MTAPQSPDFREQQRAILEERFGPDFSIWDWRIPCDPCTSRWQMALISEEQQIELSWLRASLEADLSPAWLIQEVVRRWRHQDDPPFLRY